MHVPTTLADPLRRLRATLMLVCLVTALVAAAVRAAPAAAVEPGAPPCTGMLPFADRLADPGLAVQSVSARVVSVPDPLRAGESVDQVQVTWSPGLADKGAQCIWLTSKQAGSPEYFMGGGNILQPDATQYSVIAIGQPGQYCYRIVVIGKEAQGPATDVCVDVQHPRPITTDDAMPTAPNAPTPASAVSPLPPDTGTGEAPVSNQTPLIGLGAAIALIAAGASALAIRKRARR